MAVKLTKFGSIVNEFPKLMENHLGTVILFTENRVGTVLYPGRNSALSVGYHDKSWDMKNYSEMQGSLRLENS